MSNISLIFAVDEKNGMGFKNQLPWHLPADFAHFKAYTLGKPIVMGRKTFDSIGRPLPGRQNIVISRRTDAIDGVDVAPSLDAALLLAQHAPEVMVIGGAEIFKLALPQATRIYLTRVHGVFEADVFFPKIDTTLWQETRLSRHSKDEKNAYDMSFYCYKRV